MYDASDLAVDQMTVNQLCDDGAQNSQACHNAEYSQMLGFQLYHQSQILTFGFFFILGFFLLISFIRLFFHPSHTTTTHTPK